MSLFPRTVALTLKHALDRVAAAMLMVATAPLGLVIAAAIRLESRGPVFFVQPRVGRGGRGFLIYKFRSMVDGADALLAADGRPSGPRVTRVGRLLRLTSLDELPQLLNILRGEMSLVGPRPILPENLDRYHGEGIRRFEMKPGVTGLAQVNGRNQIPWSKRVAYDLEYVAHWSLGMDTKILLHTIGVVLTGSGVVLDRNLAQADDLKIATPSSTQPPMASFAGRTETRLTGRFAKKATQERFLEEINECLFLTHHKSLQSDLEEQPTIHVVGTPRSGTTLMTQVLASRYRVGHINHLIASFWRAPVYGIRLSEKLLGDRYNSSFSSDYGRTADLTEPHEFGYFWTNLLGYPEMRRQGPAFDDRIDWDMFRLMLLNMGHAFKRPLLMKSFLLGWHMAAAQRAMPKSVFVWIRRPLVDSARSLLKARREQTGSEENWVSLKPAEYDWLRHEPPPVQVAGQIYFLDHALREETTRLPEESLVVVEHQELLADPETVARRVELAVVAHGGTMATRNELPVIFCERSGTDDSLTAQIKAALKAFESGNYPKARKAA